MVRYKVMGSSGMSDASSDYNKSFLKFLCQCAFDLWASFPSPPRQILPADESLRLCHTAAPIILKPKLITPCWPISDRANLYKQPFVAGCFAVASLVWFKFSDVYLVYWWATFTIIPCWRKYIPIRTTRLSKPPRAMGNGR